MAAETAIGWTRSTFNGWRGCEKVGPGCDFCYAESMDIRFFGGAHWGPDHKRRLASDDYWDQPHGWNKRAPNTVFAGLKGFWPVFAIAHGDIFDKWVNKEWRARLFDLIKKTPNLTWQFVTKRIGNAEEMLPPDWGRGYPNVWLLITVVNQEEADRDIPKLLRTPAALRGLSIEPQLGPVNPWTETITEAAGEHADGIDWVIAGGESRQRGGCRGYDLAWPRLLVQQCFKTYTPLFIKQLGSRPYSAIRSGVTEMQKVPILLDDSKGGNIAEWPLDLRVQQFPVAA